MYKCPKVWIVCGVSGSGKTTIARLFSEKLDCDFMEGDRRHSSANIQKMSDGIPLSHEDRNQFLLAIQADIRYAIDCSRETVITCSALKVKYREQFMALGRVQLVWIDVPTAILKQRLETRENHYFSSKMLESQIAAFEPIQPEECVIKIDGSGSLDDVMSKFISQASERFPSIAKPWWER